MTDDELQRANDFRIATLLASRTRVRPIKCQKIHEELYREANQNYSPIIPFIPIPVFL